MMMALRQFLARAPGLTPRLLFVCFFASLGAICFGYDAGWWGFILGAPAFNHHYGSSRLNAADGTVTKTLSATEQSLGTALPTVGVMLGCLITPYPMKRWGRRLTFCIVAILGIIGTVVQGLSTIPASYAILVVGKVVIGMSIGVATGSVGVYLAECSPAQIRGMIANFYGAVSNIGYTAAAGTVYGVVNNTTSVNWLVPISLQGLLPIIILAGARLIPESPRWLATQGRIEEATAALRQIRPEGEEAVKEELSQILASYEQEQRLAKGVTLLQLFRGPNLRRTLVAIGVQCVQQAQGISFTSNYLVITFQNLGYKDSQLIVLGLYVEYLVCTCFNFYLSDRFGRRRMLIVTSCILACCMIAGAAVVTVHPVPTGHLANLVIAAYVIWFGTFATSWATIPWIIASEIPTQSLRELTLATASFAGFGVGLIVTFAVPYIQNVAYGNLGGKASIGFLWGGFSIVSAIYVYFFVPETGNGRSLEVLDYMFAAGVPTREFGTFDASEIQEKLRLAAAQFQEDMDADVGVVRVTADEGDEKKSTYIM